MSPNRQADRGVIEKTRHKVGKPPMYKVFLINDDYTTMEFVIEILEEVFRQSKVSSAQIMLHVHRNGKGLAGVFTKDVAETKIAIVHKQAAEEGFPLKCDMEKA